MKLGRRKNEMYRIVLADDQAEVRDSLRRFFESDGRFEIVAEVETGDDAIRTVEAQAPDALILDLAMPGMDGLAALPKIALVAPETQVVILSSMVPFMDTRATALSLGAAAVYDKYVSPKKLIKELSSILAEASRAREISA